MLLLLLAGWLLCGAAFAESIQAVGAIGNSGAAGDSLITIGDIMKGPCATGAAVDGDLTLWLSGVDAINRVGLDGTLIEPDGDAYKTAWTIDRWGGAPDQHFGKHIRMAIDGPWAIVSDTDRHRVLWFDWTRRKLLAQFSETDKPGADAAHLSAPTLVSISGARAVVADSANQRVLKLRLIP